MTATLPAPTHYAGRLNPAATAVFDTEAVLERQARAVADAARLYIDEDRALNADVWAELGLSLLQRAEALHDLLVLAEHEADVRRATTDEDLERVTGYNDWPGDWSQRHTAALEHCTADLLHHAADVAREATA